MSICPFCRNDPFHYVDNGVGMEAVAVDCCELGHDYFMALRHGEPETVTIGWDDFLSIAGKLRLLAKADDLGAAVSELISAMQVCEGSSSKDGSNTGPHLRLDFKDFADAHRAHRALMQLAGSRD